MMTSRERVKRAVLFQGPDRVPYELPERFGSDFLEIGPSPDPRWKPKIETESRWEDEFGCIWEKLSTGDETMGQVKLHPLSDYSMLEDFKFPDYKNPERYKDARRAVSENKEEKFVLADIHFSIIHRLQYLRGFEQGLIDPYVYPKQLEVLLDKLSDIAIDAIENFAEIGVDGIISCDDWGLEDRPMVDPEIFRRFFKPRYVRVYKFARQKGMLTFLHSCGYIIDLLEDFIEADLDLIQMDQQENMGMERLAELFGGRLCFWCPVDIQKTMVNGSVEDVRDYARRLIETLGKFNGGFIGRWYASPDAVGHSREKIDAMSEAFIKYGQK